MGYGCSFYHDETEVDVSVNSANVPKPTTLLLLGSGLFGLIGFKKKIEKELTSISIDSFIKKPGTHPLAFQFLLIDILLHSVIIP